MSDLQDVYEQAVALVDEDIEVLVEALQEYLNLPDPNEEE